MKDFLGIDINISEMSLDELKHARKKARDLIYEISCEIALRPKDDDSSQSEKNSTSS